MITSDGAIAYPTYRADPSKKLEQKINSGALTIVYEQAIGSVGTWVFMK